MEDVIEEKETRVINSDSETVKGFIRMLQHKQLRQKFWFGEITFEKLNKQLLEKGINKQYEHPAAV